jgi:Antitoxin Xre/MbcA/ParS C-terminal toxin-binding domain/Antitoxin Xre-like helix-turn-helix domain
MLNIIKLGPDKPESPLGSSYSTDELRAMQRTVIALFARWGVSDVDASTILGGISAKTFRRWKDGDFGRVNRDLADRMSNLLGIHKALRIIFVDPATGYKWMRANNAAFQGRSALDVMKQGGMEDIVRIRRYLDSVRGGW